MNFDACLRKYQSLKSELNKREDKLDALKKKFKELETILKVILGLKKTKANHGQKDYDPGKYDTAYYYVQYVNNNEVVAARNFKPHQYLACTLCKKDAPLLMSYEQTYDSLECDVWEADAFIICCDKLQEFQHFSDSNRFLRIQ